MVNKGKLLSQSLRKLPDISRHTITILWNIVCIALSGPAICTRNVSLPPHNHHQAREWEMVLGKLKCQNDHSLRFSSFFLNLAFIILSFVLECRVLKKMILKVSASLVVALVNGQSFKVPYSTISSNITSRAGFLFPKVWLFVIFIAWPGYEKYLFNLVHGTWNLPNNSSLEKFIPLRTPW